MSKHRELGYALLRINFGVIFLFAGAGKFMMGISNFAASMEQQFAGKLPLALVTPFSYALPFAEVLIGTLLVTGCFTVAALLLSGLLLIALTFGTIMQGETQTAAHNIQYGLINFVLLWFAESNRYALDRLWRAKATVETASEVV